MEIKIIEKLSDGSLYRFVKPTKSYTIVKSESSAAPKNIFGPDLRRDFMIFSVICKGEEVEIGQKSDKIGTIIDIQMHSGSFMFVGTKHSGSFDQIKSSLPKKSMKKNGFSFEISE